MLNPEIYLSVTDHYRFAPNIERETVRTGTINQDLLTFGMADSHFPFCDQVHPIE